MTLRAACLRDGRATVELDPLISNEVGDPDFVPVEERFTEDERAVARRCVG